MVVAKFVIFMFQNSTIFAGIYLLWPESIKIIMKKANDKVMSAENISTRNFVVWLSFGGLGS